jgi:cytochrome c553
MKKYLKWSAIALLMLLLVLQFFQINKTNPEIKPGEDFLVINKTEASTAKLLKDACYDCHSHETKYPWYTNVVPLSWWIKKHIVKGREELNFSTWATYTAKKADHKLEESIEMLEEKKMPLKSYVIAHSEAKLSADQIKQLSDYFRSQRKTGTENGNKEKSEAEDKD